MKRNDDLIRAILLQFEESDVDIHPHIQTYSMSQEERRKYHHVELLKDAGLVVQAGKGTVRLTNQGHDFLADIKDDKIWSATKETANKVGAGSLSLLGEIAKSLVKQKISEVTGLTIGG